jgi:hypothetical protein
MIDLYLDCVDWKRELVNALCPIGRTEQIAAAIESLADLLAVYSIDG